MVISETLEIVYVDVDLQNGIVKNSRPGITTTLESPQTDRIVNLSEQIEDNISELSLRSEAPINERNVTTSPRISNERPTFAEELEAKKIYKKCLSVLRLIGFFLGYRLSYDWKPQRYFMFYVLLAVYFLAGSSSFYTIYFHFVNGNYIRVIEPLPVVGVFISTGFKINGYLSHWKQILALIFTVRKYFRRNIIGRQKEIVLSGIKNSRKFLFMFAIGCLSAMIFFVSIPGLVYLTKHERIPFIPVEIINCNQSETRGFLIATAAHFAMGNYAGFVLGSFGSAFMFCIANYILQCDLIAEDFQILDDMWNDGGIPVEHKRAFLKNVCKKRQDMNNFLKIIKYAFEDVVDKSIGAHYFAQIICLYDITQVHWIGGVGLVFGLFLEQQFYCYMGTQVTIVIMKSIYSYYTVMTEVF